MHPYRWLCGSNPTTYLCQAFAPTSFADWVQAFFAFAGIVGLGVGFWLTRESLIQIKRQNDTLADQFEFTDRAWLKTTASIGPLHSQAGQLSALIRIEIENVGRSVATDVDATATLYAVKVKGSLMHDWDSNVRQIIETTRAGHRRPDEPSLSNTLFPNERTSMELTVVIPMSDVEAQQVMRGQPPRPAAAFYLVGCAVYRMAHAPTTRVSSFGYNILRRVPNDAGDNKTTVFYLEDVASNFLEQDSWVLPIPGTFKAD